MRNSNKEYKRFYSKIRIKAKDLLIKKHKREYAKIFRIIWKKELLKRAFE